ncbi:hypothetical protein EV182_005476, partial [Spiromyces aspiralis]
MSALLQNFAKQLTLDSDDDEYDDDDLPTNPLKKQDKDKQPSRRDDLIHDTIADFYKRKSGKVPLWLDCPPPDPPFEDELGVILPSGGNQAQVEKLGHWRNPFNSPTPPQGQADGYELSPSRSHQYPDPYKQAMTKGDRPGLQEQKNPLIMFTTRDEIRELSGTPQQASPTPATAGSSQPVSSHNNPPSEVVSGESAGMPKPASASLTTVKRKLQGPTHMPSAAQIILAQHSQPFNAMGSPVHPSSSTTSSSIRFRRFEENIRKMTLAHLPPGYTAMGRDGSERSQLPPRSYSQSMSSRTNRNRGKLWQGYHFWGRRRKAGERAADVTSTE